MNMYKIKEIINVKDAIKLFKNTKVEEEYENVVSKEGFIVKGKINLKGTVVYQNDEEEEIDETFYPEILLPKLGENEELYLDQYTFKYDEKNLIVMMNFKIREKKELSIDVEHENDLLDELFNGKYETIKPKEFIDMDNVTDTINIEENSQAPIEEIKEENSTIPFEDNLDIKLEERPDSSEVDLDDICVREELIKEKYVKSYLYIKKQENESIDDIMQRLNIPFDQYQKMNDGSEVVNSSLICIKLK